MLEKGTKKVFNWPVLLAFRDLYDLYTLETICISSSGTLLNNTNYFASFPPGIFHLYLQPPQLSQTFNHSENILKDAFVCPKDSLTFTASVKAVWPYSECP